jgi:hypothetical protein
VGKTKAIEPGAVQFARERFEELAVDSAELKSLRLSLEREVAKLVFGTGGLRGLAAFVAGLNRHGHRFVKRKSDPGWTSYYESTNDGERDCFIHAQPERGGDVGTVMVLYHETLETTVKKRVASMSPRDRAKAKIEEEFAARGLRLNTGRRLYASLSIPDRLVASLHELDGGVNNGGFAAYLSNTGGERIADAAGFLRDIGARRAARIVGGVVALGLADIRGRRKLEDHIDRNRGRVDSLTAEYYDQAENIPLLAMRFLGKAGTKRRKSAPGETRRKGAAY